MCGAGRVNRARGAAVLADCLHTELIPTRGAAEDVVHADGGFTQATGRIEGRADRAFVVAALSAGTPGAATSAAAVQRVGAGRQTP